ncbi:hypothetical protein ACEPPN_016924 [Leptodophora sp. 'Broadleaf-Isolate-01']
MFNFQRLASLACLLLAVHPILATDFANLSPGCDGPEQVLSSARGCVSMADTRLMVVSTSSTTGHPDPNGIAVFIYTGDSCDGGHATLEQGTCYDAEGFHSPRVVYLPDEESASHGVKLASASTTRLEYPTSLRSNIREDRHKRINGYESTQKPLQIPTRAQLGRPVYANKDLAFDSHTEAGLLSIQNEVTHLVNEERLKNSCNRLVSVTHLVTAAQEHTDDMAARNYFDHTSPEGVEVWDRVSNAGYAWRAVAENIARDQTTPADVVDSWMGSEGHRRNILDCDLEHTGVGAAQGENGAWYWTQVFASPAL